MRDRRMFWKESVAESSTSIDDGLCFGWEKKDRASARFWRAC